MTYEVEWSAKAKDFLRTISKADAKRIGKKIDALEINPEKNPNPHGVENLSGEENIYRIRSGDYRVIYQIHDKTLYVLVLKIGNGKEIYRKL